MHDDRCMLCFMFGPHAIAAAWKASDCLQGQSALQLAASSQHGAAIEALIEHGGHPDAECRKVRACP